MENVVQRLVVMTEGDLIRGPRPSSLMRFSALQKTGLNRTLFEVETEYIRNVSTSVEATRRGPLKSRIRSKDTSRDAQQECERTPAVIERAGEICPDDSNLSTKPQTPTFLSFQNPALFKFLIIRNRLICFIISSVATIHKYPVGHS